ncbi:glycosyltransferase [Desulfatitalea alkaliphila]|uniref:Glycosyltransferase n=1 Tax=Desulfatitalea alkaliphila TaxID=2929485 RepID=A0AA41UIW9_9BACT|nr:glycosyltransferase [Desulfatitalea alkaliphila]MCJ8500549.1 glycosyltransferase [Desulfatitalea alkaliphila]
MERLGVMTPIEKYADLIGQAALDRIFAKARPIFGMRVVHINSTYNGGGVAEMLDPLSILMNQVGIETEWHLLQGELDFFSVTKKMHNALQGAEIHQTQRKMQIYEEVLRKNAARMHLNRFDRVVVHDPQPLFLINHYTKNCPWIWRCHIDLSRPNPTLMNYLMPVMDKYDAVVVSAEQYKQRLQVPQRIFMPAINPFSIKNKELTEDEVDERLWHYGIPTDLPLVVQVSRFDIWKDPQGVIDAFKIARRQVNATLVLLGNVATDDPEGPAIYKSLLDQQEDRIILISKDDTCLVNALQRKAAVVLQKSLREGFGLTVTEAMWKGTPVIGGNVGGIPLQIEDGVNGFLVSDVEEAADRIVRLLKDRRLRERMGRHARQTVIEKFLLTRLLEQYIDLFRAFETRFFLKDQGPGDRA